MFGKKLNSRAGAAYPPAEQENKMSMIEITVLGLTKMWILWLGAAALTAAGLAETYAERKNARRR